MRLFDTTYLIDLVDNDDGARQLAEKIDEERSYKAISTITAHEYIRGIHYLYATSQKLLQEKLQRAEAELLRFDILPYSYDMAKIAAELDATLAKKGQTLDLADIIIAATAKSRRLSLVTRNTRHYRRIPGLTIEPY